MQTTLEPGRFANGTRLMLNKVPEVTVYFWIIRNGGLTVVPSRDDGGHGSGPADVTSGAGAVGRKWRADASSQVSVGE